MKHSYLRIILCILTLAVGISAFAFDYFNIKGRVRDNTFDTDVVGAKVALYNLPDSTLASEVIAKSTWYSGYDGNWKEYSSSEFEFKNLPRGKKYLMQISDEKHDTLTWVIDPSTLNPRMDLMDLKNVYMIRKATRLDEVTVTATKVKFYNKGDTLVYNADAFVLSEGSMLDALVRQLPGVELKPDGQIFVNGRFVETLLLNGKDFMKGNNKVLLDNLGAYAVKNISVYDRQETTDKLLGEDFGQKKLTMDVRLKKEYSQGLMLNAEAGYGTESRYMGRLFAMWFTDHARLTFYGNSNNLSDLRKPGENTEFTPGNMESGDVKNHAGGINYNATIPKKNVEIWGDANVQYTDQKSEVTTYTTNFLNEGDTYGHSFNKSRIKSLALSTSHTIQFTKKRWNMLIAPKVDYTRNDEDANLLSGVFNREWSNVDYDFLDAVYSNAGADVIASILNRNKEQSKRRGHSLHTNLWSNGKFLLPNGTDAITYLVSGDYNRYHYNRFQRFELNFGSDPKPAEYTDRYYRNRPDYSSNAKAALGYVVALMPGMHIDTYYTFDRTYRHAVSDLFRLETLYDGTYGDAPIGQLPSLSEYRSTLDPANSYDSRMLTENHQYNIDYSWNYTPANMELRVSLPLNYRHQRLHYIRGDINTMMPRDRFFLGNLSANVMWRPKNLQLYFSYSRNVTSPDLVDMVDFTDALDPLNVRLGNPNLKDAESDNFFLQLMQFGKGNNNLMLSYQVSSYINRNALGYGYIYDRETGVRTGSMYNVDGNFGISGQQGVMFDFGPIKQFSFSNFITFDYRRSVDLVGETGVLARNIVNNYALADGLDLSYKFNGNRITLFGKGTMNRYDSGMSNFSAFNAWDIRYGIRGTFSLPANFGISTDFTVYSRRGYNDSALNTDNFVWNARISWSTLKNSLTFFIDGFDILHNLSNVHYSVNAQARTETYTNVLPRYFLFHIQWKFNKQPKKR